MAESLNEIRRYLGFCEEAVSGRAETTPEMHLDPKSVNPGMPDDPDMIYEGSMGRGKDQHRPGPLVMSPTFETGVDIKILVRQLKFALGNAIMVEGEGAGTGISPTKVYYYDESGESYANELTDFISATANDVNVPGHAAGEVDDALYIGYSSKFQTVTINVGTAKTDVSTIVWEYWDGDSWATLSVTDGTTGFTVSGEHTVTFVAPADWVVKSINRTVASFYIRARCSAFTSADVQGKITQGSIETAPDTSTEYLYSGDNILLPTQTIWMGEDGTEYVIAGVATDKFELSAENDFITLKIDSKGQTLATGTYKEKSELDLNEDYPLAYYEVDLHMRSIGSLTPWGTATKISSEVKKLVYSIENGLSESDGERVGSRFLGNIPASDRDLGLSFDRVFINNNFIELLWGNAGGPSDSTGSTEMEFMMEINAGVYGTIQVWLPRAIITAHPLDASGKTPMVPNIKVTALTKEIDIPTDPVTTVTTDCLVTAVLNFPDTTGAFDGPAWAGEI